MTARMSQRLIVGMVLVVALVLASAFVVREVRESGRSSDTVTLWIRLQMDVPSQPAGARDGDPCGFDTQPWNQLVIRDLQHTILGVYQPTSGQLEHTAESDVWRCEVVVQFEVAETDRYLIQANGATPEPIDLDQLGPAAIPIAWEDIPSADPTVSPVASPAPASGGALDDRRRR